MTATQPTVREALLTAQRNVGAVARGSRNEHHGYAYRSVDQVVNAGRKALIDAGVLVTLEEAEKPEDNGMFAVGHFVLRCEGPAGDVFEHPVTTWTQRGGGAAQVIGGLHSYAWKTGLVDLLAISYTGDDPDEHKQEDTPTEASITPGQMRKIGALMREVELTERDAALDYAAKVTGHVIQSRNDLTAHEAGLLIASLEVDKRELERAREEEPEQEPLPT